jgi:hypothetical protein
MAMQNEICYFIFSCSVHISRNTYLMSHFFLTRELDESKEQVQEGDIHAAKLR